MIKTDQILKALVKEIIFESISRDNIDLVIDSLNRIVQNSKGEDRWDTMYYALEKLTNKLGMKKIGSGVFRDVYAMENQDWVLKFAADWQDQDGFLDGSRANAEEIEIAIGKHGQGARDIFVKVYAWDKISKDYPAWLITEKVMTLDNAGKNLSFPVLQKIFPTFYNALYHDSYEKKSKKFFCEFVADTISSIGEGVISSIKIADRIGKSPWENRNSSSEKSIYPSLTKKDFYNAMVEAAGTFANDADGGSLGSSVMPIEAIRFYEDYKRITQACAYNRPDDMHGGNIGIIPSDRPSTNDIVILDYMINF